MQQNTITPGDLLEILRRRKWGLIIPFILVLSAAIAISQILPQSYKSTSVILIEERDVSEDYVSSSAYDYAERRIESIKQKILSSKNLIKVINDFGLYQDLKEKKSASEIVDKLRESINVGLINADVVDRRTGRPSEVTIAFTLSYEGQEEPERIKQVCDGLTAMFLEEFKQNREKRTEETSNFLIVELDKVKKALSEVEGQLSIFKQENINKLPNLMETNLRSFDSVERELLLLNDQRNSLQEREGALKTQLAGIPLNKEAENEEDRLDELMMELVDLQSRFSDEYPDVIKTKAEIKELKSQLTSANRHSRSKYARPDAAYVTLDAQLSSTTIEIDSTNKKIANLIQKRNEYLQRIEATPGVEVEYKAISYKRDGLQEKVNDLMKNLMEAQVSEGLERGEKGERFTVIEPAQVPIEPSNKNRNSVLLIGLVMAFGAGVGTISVMEYTDTSVRSVESLVNETSYPVLASIPEIKS